MGHLRMSSLADCSHVDDVCRTLTTTYYSKVVLIFIYALTGDKNTETGVFAYLGGPRITVIVTRVRRSAQLHSVAADYRLV